MIYKSESVNWANVWWILGADHLTFEGVMGDFIKKKILQTNFEGKKLVKRNETFPVKLSFEEFNLVFLTEDQSAWRGLNQPRQRGF